MENKIILGIDTSTDNCSVGLLKNNSIIAERSEVAKSAHSEKLILFIREILAEAGLNVKVLSGIGVNIGPGSFTGLRIGLSTAKGLAFPHNIPILPVKSLPVMIQANDLQPDILYFIKSHKNMVFYHYFKNTDEDLTAIEIAYDDITKIIEQYSDKEILGNFDFIENFGKHNTVLFPNGKAVAELVNKNFEKLKSETGPDIEPYYLTSFLAQKWSGDK